MALGSEIAILIVLLILSGFFSAAEVALVSLPRAKVKVMVDKKKIGARYVDKLKQDPNRMLATILIGNNLVNVGASALLTAIVINFFDNYAIGIATGAMTLLILVFGEITPKSIAAQHNSFVARLVSPIIWYLSIILAPILNILDSFLNTFMNLFGLSTRSRAITEDEIMSMIVEAEEEGSIKEMEKNLLRNVFEFDDINVAEVATPRTDMIAVSSKGTVDDLLKVIRKSKFSRIPVYERHRDHIVGIVFVKDIFSYMDGKHGSVELTTLMKKPYFVPENQKISTLMNQMQRRKEHMAIVVDEHGSMTGLVTLEDVLEEIVGEIVDESEVVESNIVSTSPNTWLVNGKTEIDEANAKLKMHLKGVDYDTFSGFILKIAGKIPKVNDVFESNGYKLTVVEMDKHRVNRVKAEKIKKDRKVP